MGRAALLNRRDRSIVRAQSATIGPARRFLINIVSSYVPPRWLVVLVFLASLAGVALAGVPGIPWLSAKVIPLLALGCFLLYGIWHHAHIGHVLGSFHYRQMVDRGESIPHEFGPARAWLFGATLRKKLEHLKEAAPKNWEPFLLIRGVNFRDPFRSLRAPKREAWGPLHRAALINVAYCFEHLGCRVDYKQNQVWLHGDGRDNFKDYISNWSSQKNVFDDGGDLALRFRQWSAELSVEGAGNGAMPPYVAFVCVSNPTGEPIYILPARAIGERLQSCLEGYYRDLAMKKLDDDSEDGRGFQARARSSLSSLFNTRFSKVDKYNYKLMREQGGDQGPAIWSSRFARAEHERADKATEETQDWKMAWDANKIRVNIPPGVSGSDHHAVFSAVMSAIDAASEADDAYKVVLQAGDILIIDNRRALVGRQEYDHRHLLFPNLIPYLGNRQRWLRMYYGFRE